MCDVVIVFAVRKVGVAVEIGRIAKVGLERKADLSQSVIGVSEADETAI